MRKEASVALSSADKNMFSMKLEISVQRVVVKHKGWVQSLDILILSISRLTSNNSESPSEKVTKHCCDRKDRSFCPMETVLMI